MRSMSHNPKSLKFATQINLHINIWSFFFMTCILCGGGTKNLNNGRIAYSIIKPLYYLLLCLT